MAETLYKLVRDDYTTRGNFQWEIGKCHRATGRRGQTLCSDEYLHCYRSLGQAALMANAHGVANHTRALEVTGVVVEDDGTKVGVRQCVVVREVEPVKLTTEQRVAIAIVCASRVYRDESWLKWAAGWLSGHDRSAVAAAECAVAAAVRAAANYAYAAAVRAAANYAYAAAAAECAVAAAARASDYGGINIAEICDLVLSTPESEWESLLELDDE